MVKDISLSIRTVGFWSAVLATVLAIERDQEASKFETDIVQEGML
jgi:hypothetical protein